MSERVDFGQLTTVEMAAALFETKRPPVQEPAIRQRLGAAPEGHSRSVETRATRPETYHPPAGGVFQLALLLVAHSTSKLTSETVK
jgi:hypothetical protein